MKSTNLKTTLLSTAAILVLTVLMTSTSLGASIGETVNLNLTSQAHGQHAVPNETQRHPVSSFDAAELIYLEAVSVHPIILDDYVTYEDKMAFFEAEAEKAGYIGFRFADLQGNAVALDQQGKEFDVADRKYFQNALAGEPNVSDVLVSKETGESIVVYATPVYLNENLAGVLFASRVAK
ncbi:PDC sensor domain-containing protein [Tindallia californiensis]|uniref:Methyl-accepting chemotaxis protein n=1 Tax=Tindallia californiensis TaxID=159292 RepID=A0A1H3P5S3_9FIRM|nr:hypothetical protein [Tindallia californiensis]SDY96476.1 methyl-accepting chemotaxis protein [Tindallia californiensis]